MTTKIHRSSGNVFRDLGFEPEEAESLRIRSILVGHIRKLIERRRMSQTSAAQLFGVSQPRISNLVRGRIELFSIDSLIDMLAHAGVRVHVSVKAKTRATERSVR